MHIVQIPIHIGGFQNKEARHNGCQRGANWTKNTIVLAILSGIFSKVAQVVSYRVQKLFPTWPVVHPPMPRLVPG